MVKTFEDLTNNQNYLHPQITPSLLTVNNLYCFYIEITLEHLFCSSMVKTCSSGWTKMELNMMLHWIATIVIANDQCGKQIQALLMKRTCFPFKVIYWRVLTTVWVLLNLWYKFVRGFSNKFSFLGECEHRPFQWPRVSLVLWGTLQIRIRFYSWNKQTNKQTIFHSFQLKSMKEVTLKSCPW